MTPQDAAKRLRDLSTILGKLHAADYQRIVEAAATMLAPAPSTPAIPNLDTKSVGEQTAMPAGYTEEAFCPPATMTSQRRFWSTCPRVTKAHKGCEHLKTTHLNEGTVYIFTDGASTGHYSAVIAHRGGEPIPFAGYAEPTSTRNVGAELNGALLGLTKVLDKHCAKPVVVVSDYIGIACWLTGNWKVKDPEVRSIVQRILDVARTKGINNLNFVHHRGHQTDKSDFTRLNCLADRLCSSKK